MFDVIVIGAGASGIVAAISAAREHAAVLLLEQKDRIGKKLLATGNGKCNFTNQDMSYSHFRGDLDYVEHILPQFGMEQTLSFFHEIGIYPKQKNGYYYPNSEQASSILSALETELQRMNVIVKTSSPVTKVSKSGGRFTVHTSSGHFTAWTVIYATGLLASPKLGSDGSAFPQIKECGHHFLPIVPSLCGFYAKGMDFRKVAGVRTLGCISLWVDGKLIASDTGELQLTEYGISGIPVFQVSRYASLALYEKKSVTATLHFLPEMTRQQISDELQARIRHFGVRCTPEQLLNGLLHQKLIPVIRSQIKENGSSLQEYFREAAHMNSLLDAICAFPVTLLRPREYEFAQICAGGISSKEVDSYTLSSKKSAGLYFSGELLNVDGICGGYNLQWAWSSGYIAGKSAASYAESKRNTI